MLASGGLRQYIEAVLAAHLPPELRAHVQVRANEGVFSPAGLKVRFPSDQQSRLAGCSVCGGFGTVSGGLGPYTYQVIKGDVPHGMSLSGLCECLS